MRIRLAAVAVLALAGVALPVLAAPRDKPADTRTPCRPPVSFAHFDAGSADGGVESRALMLLAVDRRVNGCRVLTPANARNDWMPEPNGEGPARKRPARGG